MYETFCVVGSTVLYISYSIALCNVGPVHTLAANSAFFVGALNNA